MRRLVSLVVSATCFSGSAFGAVSPASDFGSIHAGIFVPRCVSCHAKGKPAEDVPLDTREDLLSSPRELVLPGNPDESGLLIALTRNDSQRMPPPKSGIPPLSAAEIETVREWIRIGAP